jgi:hypothetical protein
MPKRRFIDPRGNPWEVWDVHANDIPGNQIADAHARDEFLVAIGLADGWLCFQSGSDRRRFAPIPPAWDELPDGVLRVMLDVSDPVKSELISGDHPAMG